jgi:hypothetical protein
MRRTFGDGKQAVSLINHQGKGILSNRFPAPGLAL